MAGRTFEEWKIGDRIVHVVHRTVTEYKGEIEIMSRKGMGTRVSVHLPAGREVTT